jgi:hypothetical protein
MRLAVGILLAAVTAIQGTTQTRPRGRDLGIPFEGRARSKRYPSAGRQLMGRLQGLTSHSATDK